MHSITLSRSHDSDFWAPSSARASVLVVDDDDVTLTLVRTILGDAGFDVATAPSAYDALICLDQRPFDLVILDLMLADVDGRDTCREIRCAVWSVDRDPDGVGAGTRGCRHDAGGGSRRLPAKAIRGRRA